MSAEAPGYLLALLSLSPGGKARAASEKSPAKCTHIPARLLRLAPCAALRCAVRARALAGPRTARAELSLQHRRRALRAGPGRGGHRPAPPAPSAPGRGQRRCGLCQVRVRVRVPSEGADVEPHLRVRGGCEREGSGAHRACGDGCGVGGWGEWVVGVQREGGTMRAQGARGCAERGRACRAPAERCLSGESAQSVCERKGVYKRACVRGGGRGCLSGVRTRGCRQLRGSVRVDEGM